MPDQDPPTRPPRLQPVRFGVLGAARIAPKALIDPVRRLEGVEVTRMAARDRARAEAFAGEHGIPGVSDDYAAVIEADDVDVVYNPLPMSLHATWTIAALRAGKHVFCEKPFASNAEEAAEMVAVADETGLVLAEAFHHRYHPLFLHLLEVVGGGRIGAVRRIEGVFEVPISRPDIRWNYETSGGSVMDLGCYPMSWVRHLTGEEPEVVSAVAVEDPDRIDARMEAELRFPSGATGSVRSAMDRGPEIGLRVEGSAGRIEVDNPLAPQNGNRVIIETERGRTAGPLDGGVTYDHMVRAFLDHLVHGTPFPTRGADSVANMVAIDAVYRAAGLPVRGS